MEGEFTPRRLFGEIGLIAGFASLLMFWRHRQKQVEERDQDYRALSEGLRVQIFWCLAGLSKSAAGHYMERQRNDLEWIRSALSSLVMPHHRWTRWFHETSVRPRPSASTLAGDDGPTAKACTELKRERLRWTQRLWIEDQAGYHQRRAKELKHELHFLHKVGAVLALSGALQTFVSVWEIREREKWLGDPMVQKWFATALQAGSKVALLAFFGWLILWMRDSIEVRRKKRSLRAALSQTFRRACHEYMDILVPTKHAPEPSGLRARGWRMFLAFLLHLPFAFGLAILCTAICVHLQAEYRDILPSSAKLITITSGVFLIAGALAIAWTEKNLFSEQAYQYNAMASLFNAAKSRLHYAISDLDAEADSAKWDPHIKRIQQIFYELGVEALDENAEWLILHRARPMEPVLAG